MSIAKVRGGELLALAGAVCVIVSLMLAWYEGSSSGTLDAWDTFGPGVVLLLVATAGALSLFFGTLAERSAAVSVAAAVWCIPLGMAGLIAAVLRVLERPDHATGVCAGAWLALAGVAAIFAGAWQAVHDERGSLYEPATPEIRPRP
jgi:multidrug transporter EmrE-like cation transporter